MALRKYVNSRLVKLIASPSSSSRRFVYSSFVISSATKELRARFERKFKVVHLARGLLCCVFIQTAWFVERNNVELLLSKGKTFGTCALLYVSVVFS